MVARRTLDAKIGVRIPAGQHDCEPQDRGV